MFNLFIRSSCHRVVIIQNQTAGCPSVVPRFYGPSVTAVNLRVITFQKTCEQSPRTYSIKNGESLLFLLNIHVKTAVSSLNLPPRTTSRKTLHPHPRLIGFHRLCFLPPRSPKPDATSNNFGSLGIAGNAPRCCGLGAWLKLWQAEVEQNLF